MKVYDRQGWERLEPRVGVELRTGDALPKRVPVRLHAHDGRPMSTSLGSYHPLGFHHSPHRVTLRSISDAGPNRLPRRRYYRHQAHEVDPLIGAPRTTWEPILVLKPNVTRTVSPSFAQERLKRDSDGGSEGEWIPLANVRFEMRASEGRSGDASATSSAPNRGHEPSHGGL